MRQIAKAGQRHDNILAPPQRHHWHVGPANGAVIGLEPVLHDPPDRRQHGGTKTLPRKFRQLDGFQRGHRDPAAQPRPKQRQMQPVADPRGLPDEPGKARFGMPHPHRGQQDQPLDPFGMGSGKGGRNRPAQRIADQRQILAQPLIGEQIL